jgi:hypothetical protein
VIAGKTGFKALTIKDFLARHPCATSGSVASNPMPELAPVTLATRGVAGDMVSLQCHWQESRSQIHNTQQHCRIGCAILCSIQA